VQLSYEAGRRLLQGRAGYGWQFIALKVTAVLRNSTRKSQILDIFQRHLSDLELSAVASVLLEIPKGAQRPYFDLTYVSLAAFGISTSLKPLPALPDISAFIAKRARPLHKQMAMARPNRLHAALFVLTETNLDGEHQLASGEQRPVKNCKE
jgi:hypothetical protein